MTKFYQIISMLLLLPAFAFAQTTINTPGTGVNWNMDSLVAHYPSTVQLTGTVYHVSDKIVFSPTDTFQELADAYVTFDSAATFEFKKSTVIIDPMVQVEWIAQDTSKSFLRVRFDSAVYVNINHLIVRYSSGLTFINSDANIDNIILDKTYHRGNNPSGALSLLNSDLNIINSQFILSQRSAITLSVNSGSSLFLSHSNFVENGTSNGNYPQINIGTPNSNGVVVEYCNVYGKYTKVGALAFLNVTPNNYAVMVKGNKFIKNRYGIAVNGRGIDATIVDNTIDSNNIEGLPMMGGSGINILGDSSLKVIAANNEISSNLWGVTVQKSGNNGSPIVSFGKILPSNPIDTGGNYFYNNGFNDTLYAIYNNTPDTVWAQRNRWDFEQLDSIETTIFHHVDDTTLGWVLFDSFYVTPPIDTSNSVHQVMPKANFASIYPNPGNAQNASVLEADNNLEGIRIMDINGRIVHQQQLKAVKTYQLPSTNLSKGIYYVWITDGKSQQVLKWVLNKE